MGVASSGLQYRGRHHHQRHRLHLHRENQGLLRPLRLYLYHLVAVGDDRNRLLQLEAIKK
jgi:hypothetical protein